MISRAYFPVSWFYGTWQLICKFMLHLDDVHSSTKWQTLVLLATDGGHPWIVSSAWGICKLMEAFSSDIQMVVCNHHWRSRRWQLMYLHTLDPSDIQVSFLDSSSYILSPHLLLKMHMLFFVYIFLKKIKFVLEKMANYVCN